MKLSILNLAPVREGQTYLQAVDSMVNLAKHAERIGIERYWIAEHHNMKNFGEFSDRTFNSAYASQYENFCAWGQVV